MKVKEIEIGNAYEANLRALKSDESLENIGLIVEYLKSGAVFAVSPGLVFDILNDEKGSIGEAVAMTDGVWAWYGELAYYVMEYSVRLPDEFLEHMKKNNWQIPNKENLNIDDLEFC